MSPSFFTRQAERFFPRRWAFLAVSVAGMALVFAAVSTGSAKLAAAAGVIAGPFIFVPWALLCMCVWFHPVRGNLQPSSRLIGRLPSAVQFGIRWYASLVLAMFVIVGAVVWPALSFSRL
ncbi:MAG: hypothetical protein V4857_29675 [Pseudomonadota bacterium]